MTPDQALQRCRPGWRSNNPEEEAQTRNDELLEARGELVTLFTKRIKGDDITDRQIGPPINNFVSALPLKLIFTFDSSRPAAAVLTSSYESLDPRFSPNLAGFFSDLRSQRFNGGKFKPRIIAQRPQPTKTNYLYIGHHKKFFNLSIKLFQRVISDNIVWEYSRGNNVWFPVPMDPLQSTPKASTMQETGRMVFDNSFSSQWNQDYVNGNQAFWIRAVIDEDTEGVAEALIICTEDIIQSVLLWTEEDDPFLFPNDRCITIKVNNKIYNRVYDIKQLDYSRESFVLIRRSFLGELCGIQDNPENNDHCGLNPLDTCEDDPTSDVKGLGDMMDTSRTRELAFLYHQIMRFKQNGNSDAMVLLFTRNLDLTGTTITASYVNRCPCTAFGRQQNIRDQQLPDDSSCLICYGTEFINGYVRYVNPARADGKIFASFPQGPFDMPHSAEGHGISTEHELTTVRFSHQPKIHIRDFIIRYDDNETNPQETLRYIIDTRTDSRGRRGILLHQEAVIKALDPDKFAYRIEAPSLPLAPTQAQVLQSLGLLVPDNTPDECVKERIDKANKDCRPERLDRRE